MNVMVKFDYCDTLKETIAYGRNRSYKDGNEIHVCELDPPYGTLGFTTAHGPGVITRLE